MQAGAKAYIEMDQQLNRPVSQQKKVCSSVVCVCLICDNVMPITPGINHNPACGTVTVLSKLRARKDCNL